MISIHFMVWHIPSPGNSAGVWHCAIFMIFIVLNIYIFCVSLTISRINLDSEMNPQLLYRGCATWGERRGWGTEGGGGGQHHLRPAFPAFFPVFSWRALGTYGVT